MNLTFFGSAGSVQSAASSNTSFLLSHGSTSVLVDTSGSPEQNLQRVGSSCLDVDAVVLTHSHVDHLYAFPSLLHQLWILKRTKPLLIVANHATTTKARQLGAVFDLWNRDWSCELRWLEVEDETVTLGDLQLSVFPVEHSAPTLGLKFSSPSGTLAYSADTVPTERVTRAASDADWLIHEAGYGLNAAAGSDHATALQAAAVAQRAGVRTLFLCHLDLKNVSASQLREEAARQFTGDVIIPELFRQYQLTAAE